MKKTMLIDEQLLRRARKILGAATDTETVRLALEEVLRADAYERAAKLIGSEKGKPLQDVPRRREPARKTRKRAA